MKQIYILLVLALSSLLPVYGQMESEWNMVIKRKGDEVPQIYNGIAYHEQTTKAPNGKEYFNIYIG